MTLGVREVEKEPVSIVWRKGREDEPGTVVLYFTVKGMRVFNRTCIRVPKYE